MGNHLCATVFRILPENVRYYVDITFTYHNISVLLIRTCLKVSRLIRPVLFLIFILRSAITIWHVQERIMNLIQLNTEVWTGKKENPTYYTYVENSKIIL